MKLFGISTVAAVVWLGSATVASAQPVVPGQVRPTFSPYLNLLRGDSSPAVNYFGLVRPEQQIRRNQAALGQALLQTNQTLDDSIKGADPTIPATGHAAMFNNTLHYFGGGGGGGNRPQVFGGGQRPQVMGGGQRPQVFPGGGGGGALRR